MEQKAKVNFDAASNSLVIEGELLPVTPTVHDMLAELVGGKLTASVKFTNEKNVIRYRVAVAAKE